jgi:hypothetical protein
MHIKESIELGPGATKLVKTITGETLHSGTREIEIPESVDNMLGVVADLIIEIAPHALAAWADMKKMSMKVEEKDGNVHTTLAPAKEEAAEEESAAA